MSTPENPNTSSKWRTHSNTSSREDNQRAFNIYANFQPTKKDSRDSADGIDADKLSSIASTPKSIFSVPTSDYSSINRPGSLWAQCPDSTNVSCRYPSNSAIERSETHHPAQRNNSTVPHHRNYGGTLGTPVDDGSCLCSDIEFQVPEAYEQALIDLAKSTGELRFEPMVSPLSQSLTFQFFDLRAPGKLYESAYNSPQFSSARVTFKPLNMLEAVAIDIPWGINFDQSQLCPLLASYGDILEVQYEHGGAVNKAIAQDRLLFFFYDIRVPMTVPPYIIVPGLNSSFSVPTYKFMITYRKRPSTGDIFTAFPEPTNHENNIYSHHSNNILRSGASSYSGSSLFGSVGSINSDSLRGSTMSSYPGDTINKSDSGISGSEPFDFSALHISDSDRTSPFLTRASDIPKPEIIPNAWGSSRIASNTSSITPFTSGSSPKTNLDAFKGVGIDCLGSATSPQRASQASNINQNELSLHILHKYVDTPSVLPHTEQQQAPPLSPRSHSHPNLLSDHRNVSIAQGVESQALRKFQSVPAAHKHNQHQGNTRLISHSPGKPVPKSSASSASSTSRNKPQLPGRSTRNTPRGGATGNSASTNIDVKAIEDGKEQRTTVMVCNIPNKLEFDDFKKFIDETSAGKYEFLYLRFDFSNRCNVGYAFVSFAKSSDLKDFVEKRAGMKWNSQNYNSEKVIDIKFARIQGRESLIRKFRSSPVMHQEPAFRPRFYNTEGPLAGKEIPF